MIKAVWFSEHASMMCFHDQISHVRSTAIGLLYYRLQFPRGVVYPTTDLTRDQSPTRSPTSVPTAQEIGTWSVDSVPTIDLSTVLLDSTQNRHARNGPLHVYSSPPNSYFIHLTQPWPSPVYLLRTNVSDIRGNPTPSPTNAMRSSANDLRLLLLYTEPEPLDWGTVQGKFELLALPCKKLPLRNGRPFISWNDC